MVRCSYAGGFISRWSGIMGEVASGASRLEASHAMFAKELTPPTPGERTVLGKAFPSLDDVWRRCEEAVEVRICEREPEEARSRPLIFSLCLVEV